jgi:hypothetical protein
MNNLTKLSANRRSTMVSPKSTEDYS